MMILPRPREVSDSPVQEQARQRAHSDYPDVRRQLQEQRDDRAAWFRAAWFRARRLDDHFDVHAYALAHVATDRAINDCNCFRCQGAVA